MAFFQIKITIIEEKVSERQILILYQPLIIVIQGFKKMMGFQKPHSKIDTLLYQQQHPVFPTAALRQKPKPTPASHPKKGGRRTRRFVRKSKRIRKVRVKAKAKALEGF